MLVRWKSPKCQTAYRLLSPCNLNSQHQSDKLSDRPRVWRTCLRRMHVQKRQQWKGGRKKKGALILLTTTGERRRCECSDRSRCRAQGSARSTVPLCFESTRVIRLLAPWLGQCNEFIRGFSWGNGTDAFHCALEGFFPPAAYACSSTRCAQSSVPQQRYREGEEIAHFTGNYWKKEGTADTESQLSLSREQKKKEREKCDRSAFALRAARVISNTSLASSCGRRGL